MQRLLLLAALRFHLRQPWQLGLAIAGITLGIAAFVGIQNANRAAVRSFELSTGLFGSGITHRVIPAGRELPVDVYERLVLAGFGNAVAPIASVFVEDPDDSRRRLELIGVDPIKERSLRRFVPGTGDALFRLLTEPDAILVPAGSRFATADSENAPLDVTIDGEHRSLRRVGSFTPAGTQSGEVAALVTVIDTVFELGARRSLSRVDLVLDNGDVDRIRALLPPGAALVEAGNQNADLAAMTRAFTTNLTALGLLALIVGLFLIQASMSFAVVRRRPVIATFRALGVTRSQIVGAIAIEAAAIGAVAGIAGGVLGSLMSGGLVDLVLRTMDDLAFSRAVAAQQAGAWMYPMAVGIGIGASLLAAALPALEGASVPPASGERRSDLESRVRRGGKLLALAAGPVLLAAAIVLLASPGSLALGFLGLFLVLVAGALSVPLATTALMRLIEGPVRLALGLTGVMAVRSVTASLSRTGVATAALAIAVATVISIGLMIGSFRASLVAWIDRTLTADVYVLLDSSASEAGEIESWTRAIAELPQVAGTSLTRRSEVPGPFGTVEVRAARPGPEGWGLDVVDTQYSDWSERLARGEGIVVAEPYAYRHRLVTGTSLTLRAVEGDARFEILAIARDYNTSGAGVIMALDTYRALWADDGVSGIGVHLQPGADAEAAETAIGALRPAGAEAAFRSTAGIRDISLMLFDRTFEITGVLRTLAGIVAFFGVLSAVLALQIERLHELALLRSLGMSLVQLRTNLVVQTSLLGLAAAAAAVPIGAALAWLLVFVINKRAFGWSMDFELAMAPIGNGIVLAIVAATLSGVCAAFAGRMKHGAIRSAPF